MLTTCIVLLRAVTLGAHKQGASDRRHLSSHWFFATIVVSR
jgi:hypothetical protein